MTNPIEEVDECAIEVISAFSSALSDARSTRSKDPSSSSVLLADGMCPIWDSE